MIHHITFDAQSCWSLITPLFNYCIGKSKLIKAPEISHSRLLFNPQSSSLITLLFRYFTGKSKLIQSTWDIIWDFQAALPHAIVLDRYNLAFYLFYWNNKIFESTWDITFETLSNAHCWTRIISLLKYFTGILELFENTWDIMETFKLHWQCTRCRVGLSQSRFLIIVLEQQN